MAFTPSTFLSHIRSKDGPARPCRFEVILPIPSYINKFVSASLLDQLLNLPNALFTDVSDAINGALGKDTVDRGSNATISRYLSMQCETAELPGKTLQTHDVKIYGPTFKVPYQTQYTETTLGFLCTNDFYERKLFDRWLEAIMPTDTNNLTYPKGDKTRYMTTIRIVQYDDFIKQIYAVELIDAFPVGIASQGLSWSDDGFHRLSVQFAYQKFRTIYAGTYDIGAAATELLGVGLNRLLPFGKAL